MHKALYLAVAAAAVLASPAIAMGGGYGGMNAMPTVKFDDYTTAKQLIKQQDHAKTIPLNAAHEEMNALLIPCPDSCDERDTLSKALAAYVPSTAPAFAAVPAEPQAPAASQS